MAESVALASGAEARWTNDARALAVVLVNGGRLEEVPGTWSASLEWLVRRLAPRFPQLGFLEVRYRVKSWRRLDLCVEDARAALELAVAEGAARCTLVGYSMGGGVAVEAAEHPAVTCVVGLAPSISDGADLEPLRGRRFAVAHGALDRPLPGLAGVHPDRSRRAFERARALGVRDADYTLVRGGLHAVAVRPAGFLVPLPRAHRWAALLEDELTRFAR